VDGILVDASVLDVEGAFVRKGMSGCAPTATVASRFARLLYALSPDSSRTVKLRAVASTIAGNCGASPVSCLST
jgi:hypothetical protein